MNKNDYGILPNTQNLPGIPARVTAVHKERFEIVCEHGMTHARLKTKEYYVDTQDFPTTGDFVMINYIPNGDSQIIATLPRRTYFSRREKKVFLGRVDRIRLSPLGIYWIRT